MKNRRAFLRQGAALVTGAASAGIARDANTQSLAGQPWERVYGAPFDVRSLRVTGKPVPLLQEVIVKAGGAIWIIRDERWMSFMRSTRTPVPA